jgi:hypothetical protein
MIPDRRENKAEERTLRRTSTTSGLSNSLRPVNSERLALELAERIREVVPVGISVRVDKDMLWFADESGFGSGTYACQVLNTEEEQEPSHRLVEACWRALDDLQDFIDESTTDPWPGDETLPKPGAWIEGDEVVLWYGDAEHPALRLRPLPLDI